MTFRFILLLTCLSLPCSTALAESWSVSLGGGVLMPNGEFSVVRANGKVVRTDIEPAAMLSLSIERTLTKRVGLIAGVVIADDQEIWLRQNLPDGTVDIKSDMLSSTMILVGAPIHFLVDSDRWDLFVTPAITLTSFGDVNLGTAGPPYDLPRPLDLEVDDDFGAGGVFGVARRVGDGRWSLRAEASLFATRMQGYIRNDADDPEPDPDVDLPYNPLSVTLGVSYRF